MFKRFLCALFTSIVACLAVTAGNAHAQVVNDTRILSVSISPATVKEFAPLTIKVTFDRDVCVNESAMMAGARVGVDYLTISLANLASQGNSCATTKQFVWPGLPAGTYSVNVGMGRFSPYPMVNSPSTFVLATQASASLEIQASGAATIPIYLINFSSNGPGFTWLFDVLTTNYATVGLGSPININEVPGPAMAAFTAWPSSSTAAGTTDLYELLYILPDGQGRYFYTARADERDKLIQAGFTRPISRFKVIAAVGETCATGLRPIYRLFNPALTAHKFVGADTQALLAGSGWINEKVAFCVAPDQDRGTRWQPN